MPADFTFKQGDAGPVVQDTLTFSDGTPAPLIGASIVAVMRSLTSNQPVKITGLVTILNANAGTIQWSPTTADTSNPPGAYMLTWEVTYQTGQLQTFPTQGYLWGIIEPSLNTITGEYLASLPDVKDYCNVSANNREHDEKLLGFLQDVTPLIEQVVGPVITRTIEEWHEGGQYWVTLRHKPSYALGTNPIYNIVGCDEYRGPIKYTLSVITDPTAASIYSCMLDQRTGVLYRRSTGGAVIPFGAGPWGGGMPQAVHVVYQAGQATIPGNVRRAALEAVRWLYESSQATGIGSRTLADNMDYTLGTSSPARPYALPPSAMQWLTPMRRRPAIA